jgi:hypothetical protein
MGFEKSAREAPSHVPGMFSRFPRESRVFDYGEFGA